MRTTSDRIRHAISFEAIALFMLVPLGAWLFHMPVHDIGVVGLVSATIATGWNYLYNLIFDRAMQRRRGTTQKTLALRIVHALLFEAGLLTVLLPFIAWYLGVSLWTALVMDVSFSLFYVVYTFGFNWAYDRLFPLPEWQVTKAAH
ncbi:PACE efflux transporter [uncultured Maritimibacter sp.]|jgi:uncharacterized membrane protein|uniref:PACE efflux transporter n=1 Tax=uncultured Maritimibacter sp. TaxID=991866 RepID=UPI000AEC1AD2|nr:PACE efflux transporter [uncultured Maritimibacter sp.]